MTVEASGEPLIRLKNVSKRFTVRERQIEVLREISFDIHAGEFLAIVGPSGCGKSTLLRMIQGLEPLSSGRIEFARERNAASSGFVFQRDGLYPWRTVLRNVSFGLELEGKSRKAADARSRRMIELVGLKGYEGHHPNELSGGMRQRVNLARALAIDPTVLLMDEPFAALDALTRENMQQELIRIAGATRKTVVLITHQIDEAILLGDRVLVLNGSPSAIDEVISIDLPRPRSLSLKRSRLFQDYVSRVWFKVSGHSIDYEINV